MPQEGEIVEFIATGVWRCKRSPTEAIVHQRDSIVRVRLGESDGICFCHCACFDHPGYFGKVSLTREFTVTEIELA